MSETNSLIIKVLQTIYQNPAILVINPGVTVDSGKITINGSVDAKWKKAAIGDLIKTEIGAAVENNLQILSTEMDRAI